MTAEEWRRVREYLHSAAELHGDERAHYLDCVEPGLRPDVERLLTALDASTDFLEPATPPCATKVGPYLILEEADRGGMGLVYRAVREDDYRQVVALKMVRPEIETGPLLARFRRERQMLALLNHPNIAHLLDGGTTPEGRPYLVMEWIEGTPITEHCAAGQLPLRLRVELFLTVCQAVAHAHRHLVVHRDLKPSNILITTEGVPKLLDFGIARLLSDDDGGLTHAGARALTPDYASPEQIRGEPPTTATDIYSLGAVLYELLAVAKPHRFTTRTAAELERVVCEQGVVRPSEAANNKALRGDLDNIVLKALEKDPQRRYSHVEALAADLRRYLEGRPVSARPQPVWYRATKFVGRNKTLVAAAAAVVVALTAGLTLALWQARDAQRQRALAERRFDLARHVADSLLYEITDEIHDLAGSNKARALLLRRSLEYLGALSREAASNPQLQRDLANAYLRAAELQGVAGVSNLGDPAAARTSLRKATDLLESALAAQPRSVEIRRDLAKAHRQFVYQEDDPKAELEHAKRSLALVEDLRKERPADPSILSDLQTSEFTLARTLVTQSRYPEAVACFRRALRDSAATEPSNLALTHKSLGAVLIRTGALDEAMGQYQAATAIDEQRVRAEPANGRARLDLSYDYSDTALILGRLRQTRASVEHYRKARVLRAAMAAADPHDARAATALVSVEYRLGCALARDGRRGEAEQAFHRSVREGEAMLVNLPDPSVGSRSLADATWNIALCYREVWNSCALATPWLLRSKSLYQRQHKPTSIIDKNLAECAAGAAKTAQE